jgi:hypothetical protein
MKSKTRIVPISINFHEVEIGAILAAIKKMKLKARIVYPFPENNHGIFYLGSNASAKRHARETERARWRTGIASRHRLFTRSRGGCQPALSLMGSVLE